MSGYAKLYSSIIFSTVWRGTSKDVKILWVAMLALSDPDGLVEASIPGLAAAADMTLVETEAALLVLMSPDTYSKNPANDGRRVERREGGFFIFNYRGHRDKLTIAARRESTRERVRKHRENKAREAAAVAASQPEPVEPATDFDGSPDETVCPLDIVARGEKIFDDMLEHMPGVTKEQLRDKTREFLTYWTIGGGKFKKRRFWMRKLREDLRQAFEKKRLKAPGEIEHDERKPKPVPLSDGAAKLIAMAKEEDAKRGRRRAAATLPRQGRPHHRHPLRSPTR